MKFEYDEVLDLWIGETEFIGRPVKVRLYCADDDDFSGIAAEAMRAVAANWESIKSAIIAELLPTYIDQSGKQLAPDEFFGRLSLKTIDVDTVDFLYTLFWSDSGLFGGHSIQLFWDPEKKFQADVSLVG